MKDKTKETQLQVIEAQGLERPESETKFAHEAAKFLVDIIKKNQWARRLGGQSEHIQYEGWQTAGKFYGYTVKTLGAEYVEYGGTWGFKARAIVVNEKTGIEVGGAEALCMSDEPNWSRKPKFQLASMAQTRAGSKALRQILGFVVALAGYSPTPVEEMDGVLESPRLVKSPSYTGDNGLVHEPIEESQNALDDTTPYRRETLKEKAWCKVHTRSFIGRDQHGNWYKKCVQGNKTNEDCEIVVETQ